MYNVSPYYRFELTFLCKLFVHKYSEIGAPSDCDEESLLSLFSSTFLLEPITVEVSFRNPLKVPLLLTDLSLLWKFQPKEFGAKHDGETKELVRKASSFSTPNSCRYGVYVKYSQFCSVKTFKHKH